MQAKSASSTPHTPRAYSLRGGHDIGDYRQLMLAQDISYAHGHFQLWAEFFQTRFEIPTVGHADTFAYYIEAKYKFTPQLFGALRWNQQLYGDIPDGLGGETAWGQELKRIDAVIGYRPTENTQVKLQYSLEHLKNSARDYNNILAGQFVLKF
jgi:predicted porin